MKSATGFEFGRDKRLAKDCTPEEVKAKLGRWWNEILGSKF